VHRELGKNLAALLASACFLISVCTGVHAQVMTPEAWVLQEVHKTNLSKDAIFARSLEWMAQTFVDSKQVVELQDKENGKIIGKGLTEFMNGITPTPCRFTMMIEAKDNKYRVTYSNLIGMWGKLRDIPKPLVHPKLVEQVEAKLRTLDASLYSYLSKEVNSEDW
jgi:hypothetical protein